MDEKDKETGKIIQGRYFMPFKGVIVNFLPNDRILNYSKLILFMMDKIFFKHL